MRETSSQYGRWRRWLEDEVRVTDPMMDVIRGMATMGRRLGPDSLPADLLKLDDPVILRHFRDKHATWCVL